jgi:hypothetical protein
MQTVVFLCGILPAVFVFTGLVIWLRSRRAKAIQRGVSGVPHVGAAE